MAAAKTSRTGGARKPRRKISKNVTNGHAYIKSTFNNTIVSLTDPTGAVVAWASSGQVGFKGSRKSTPFAAQLAAEAAAPAVRPRSVPSRPPASRSVRSRTSRLRPSTAPARRSAAAADLWTGGPCPPHVWTSRFTLP